MTATTLTAHRLTLAEVIATAPKLDADRLDRLRQLLPSAEPARGGNHAAA